MHLGLLFFNFVRLLCFVMGCDCQLIIKENDDDDESGIYGINSKVYGGDEFKYTV